MISNCSKCRFKKECETIDFKSLFCHEFLFKKYELPSDAIIIDTTKWGGKVYKLSQRKLSRLITPDLLGEWAKEKREQQALLYEQSINFYFKDFLYKDNLPAPPFGDPIFSYRFSSFQFNQIKDRLLKYPPSELDKRITKRIASMGPIAEKIYNQQLGNQWPEQYVEFIRDRSGTEEGKRLSIELTNVFPPAGRVKRKDDEESVYYRDEKDIIGLRDEIIKFGIVREWRPIKDFKSDVPYRDRDFLYKRKLKGSRKKLSTIERWYKQGKDENEILLSDGRKFWAVDLLKTKVFRIDGTQILPFWNGYWPPPFDPPCVKPMWAFMLNEGGTQTTRANDNTKDYSTDHSEKLTKDNSLEEEEDLIFEDEDLKDLGIIYEEEPEDEQEEGENYFPGESDYDFWYGSHDDPEDTPGSAKREIKPHIIKIKKDEYENVIEYDCYPWYQKNEMEIIELIDRERGRQVGIDESSTQQIEAMHFEDGMSIQEIADQLGIDKGFVSRTVKKLTNLKVLITFWNQVEKDGIFEILGTIKRGKEK